MKKIKSYLWKGALCLLAAALLLTLLLAGHGLRLREPQPLPAQSAASIRPEGQSAEPTEPETPVEEAPAEEAAEAPEAPAEEAPAEEAEIEIHIEPKHDDAE